MSKVIESVLERVQYGELTLELPGGTRRVFSGDHPGPRVDWRIRNGRLARRMLTSGLVGFAESYMDGDWDSSDLVALIAFGEMNRAMLGRLDGGSVVIRALNWLVHRLRPNDKVGARRNISAHYDLGNEFYRLWLDETMTYSSAVFANDHQPLADAQRNKYERILRLLSPGPDSHLLEIGSGWGGFALHAARTTGCRVTSITLSREQLDEARRRAQEAGLADRVEFRLQDYRDTDGTYDGIASIEMFEAVGERYWPNFFRTVHARLKPEARAALQVITIRDDLFPEYREGVDFIQRYIFPGGMLPSPAEFARQARGAGLATVARSFHRMHYARTLAAWHERFLAAQDHIAALGYDERFMRMWRYYLAYCEAGFRRGTTDLLQIALRRSG